MDLRSFSGLYSGWDEAISNLLLQAPVSRQSVRSLLKIMVAIVGAWITAFFFTTLLECGTKFEYLWSTLSNHLSHCIDNMTYQTTYATSDIVTDILILAMPIPIVRI